jgi:hypothetical protein
MLGALKFINFYANIKLEGATVKSLSNREVEEGTQ